MNVRASRVVFHAAADEAGWVHSAVAVLVRALRDALAEAGDVHVLLSGGRTPAPVYRALAAQDLDWSRLIVGLVDERDVEPDAEGSNAWLVRENLLLDAARSARFEPLRGVGESLVDACARANARLRGVRVGACVLGMGDDGHTASLFPGSIDLDAALASRQPYAVVDATGCAVAAAHPHRISLTPAGFALSPRHVLLIRGATKRAVFERALGDGAVGDAPIRAVLDFPGASLQACWCP